MRSGQGTYNGRTTASTSCTWCPSGYFCDGTGQSAVDSADKCAEGSYGGLGEKSAACSGVCSEGRVCSSLLAHMRALARCRCCIQHLAPTSYSSIVQLTSFCHSFRRYHCPEGSTSKDSETNACGAYGTLTRNGAPTGAKSWCSSGLFNVMQTGYYGTWSNSHGSTGRDSSHCKSKRRRFNPLPT